MSWNECLPRIRRPIVASVGLLLALSAAAAAQPAGHGGPGDATFGQAVRGNFAIHAGLPAPAHRLARLDAAFREAAPSAMTFAFDSARLDAEAERTLAAQAAWLRLNPHATLRFEGHADRVGGESYNDRLGLRRARAAAARLVELGVDPARLVAVESFGERRPAVDVPGPEPLNRRAVVALVGWGRPYPAEGFDGKRALNTYRRYVSDQVEQARAEGPGN